MQDVIMKMIDRALDEYLSIMTTADGRVGDDDDNVAMSQVDYKHESSASLVDILQWLRFDTGDMDNLLHAVRLTNKATALLLRESDPLPSFLFYEIQFVFVVSLRHYEHHTRPNRAEYIAKRCSHTITGQICGC
jgi:hypothetical protein